MLWSDLCRLVPNQWVVIEALAAHSEEGRRELDDVSLVETCPDGSAAFKRYRAYHLQAPEREFLPAHTSNEHLEIHERVWTGIRWGDAPPTAT